MHIAMLFPQSASTVRLFYACHIVTVRRCRRSISQNTYKFVFGMEFVRIEPYVYCDTANHLHVSKQTAFHLVLHSDSFGSVTVAILTCPL